MLTLHINASRDISFNFSYFVALVKPRSHRSSGIFFYVKSPSLLYLLVFFPDILDPVTASLFFTSEHVWGVTEVLTEMSTWQEKGNCHKRKIIVCGGFGNFPQKNFAQRIYLYINKSLQKICCSISKALYIMAVFSLTIQLNPIEKQSVITTKVLSFLEKKTFTIFT